MECNLQVVAIWRAKIEKEKRKNRLAMIFRPSSFLVWRKATGSGAHAA